MSDLNKFEPTEAWFARLKSFLLREGSPITHLEDENSLEKEDLNPDLSRSFLNILEERRKQQKGNSDNDNMQEDKENINLETFKESQQSSHRMSPALSYVAGNESTIVREQSLWRYATDESFEFLEHMYDKTLYDTTNTALKNVDLNTSSAENLKRKGNITKICVADQTQLNDIEAPSTMWNNSVLGDDKSLLTPTPITQFQTSPVKMIGLLRPSTILEESCGDFSDDNSVSSGSVSFKTVPTLKLSDATSLSTEQFQSANDDESYKTETKWETLGNNSDNTENEDSIEAAAENVSKLSLNSEKSTSSSLSTSTSFKKYKFYDENIKIGLLSPAESRQSVKTQSLDSLNSNKTDTDAANSESNTSILNDSLNVNRSSSSHQISNDSLTSDVKLSNSGLSSNMVKENLIDFDKSISDTIKQEPKYEKSSETIEISDDENENSSKDECGLNRGFSMQEEDSDTADNSNISDKDSSLDHTLNNTPREFNDTIEEMEYILQKGMKYLSATGTTPKLIKSAISSSESLQNQKQLYTPSPNTFCKSPITPRTVIAKPLMKNPEPTGESTNKEPIQFKVPTTSRIPQPKQLSSVKKQLGFQHIISPVGAYIKNTAVTPIIASSKSKSNLQDTKVVRNLEYQGKFNSPSKMKMAGPVSAKSASGLPKKAYISSEYKHYVDERTPIKIPGGDKIHKYLDSAKLPTVIKHDGRVKLNDLYSNENEKRKTELINRTVDSSIADLSVMSGEISLLTIKDAQKFGHK